MIFYKPKKYKQTPIGQVPKEWRVVKLGDVAEIKTGSSNVQDANKDGSFLFFDRSGEVKRSDKYLYDKEAVIVPGEGKDFLPKYYFGKFDLHQRAYAIFDFSDLLFGRYLFYAMHELNKVFYNWAVGSTVKSLRLPMFKNLLVPLPPLSEQQKISEVLSKIDEAVEAVSESIEKWQKIKKAAMRQLLTRGIGHKKFKYVEGIGEMPEEWEVKKVKDIFIVKNGTTPPTRNNKYWEDGTINWITPEDLSKINGQKKFFTSRRKITEIALNETRVNLLNPGDIILSTRAPVGYVAVLMEQSTFNQGCRGLMAKQKVDPFFFAYLFDFYNKKLQDLSGGSTFKELSKSVLEGIKLQVSSLTEQQKIASILQKIDQVIETKQQKKEHLERVRKEMMRLLLTGRVRIKI